MAKTNEPAKRVSLATLTSLLGKTVDDPAVVAVFEKAGKMKISSDLAVAKEAGFDFALERVDGKKKVLHTLFLFPEGGDGHRGVSYMGTKLEIAGKNQLGIQDVAFYADAYEHPIRGIGKTVRFRGYPGLLPYGLRLGDPRETVRAKVGATETMTSGEDYDSFATKARTTSFRYEADKLVVMRVGRPRA